jgi:PAS domain S-box-containing protein
VTHAVLLVERDPAVCAGRARLLRQAGFEVLEAASGADALGLATAAHPALVLLGPQLPDPEAVAQRLAADPATASLPVLALAAALEAPEAIAQRLVESERRFQRLYEADLIGIVTASAEQIVDANDVFLSMVGYSREDLLAGRVRWPEMTPPEHRPADARALEELARTGRAAPYEKEYFRKDGSRVPILVGATTLRESPPQWFCFILDLSERKRLERKVLETEKLEGIGLLAGGIAHDFNNLLTVILGNASLALRGKRSRSTPYVEAIAAAGERAAQLTRQLLACAGKGQFLIEELSLSTLISDNRELLRLSVPGMIELRLEPSENLPAIRADRRQLQQILMNVVLNAAEAIGSSQGLIAVRTAVETFPATRPAPFAHDLPPGRYVLLQVADTGSGMTEAVKAQLFDPFFTTKSTGRGLGLPAVAGIVRSCGGAIEVDSTAGGGTRFNIFFPAARTEAAVEAELPAPARSGSATILVVDDERYVREFMTAALRKRGYRVLSAGDGQRALELLEANPDVELLLVDVVMPVMAGDALVRTVRAARPWAKVLLTSGWSREEVRRLCAGTHGEIDFIQKPYSADRLVARIEALLRPKGVAAG